MQFCTLEGITDKICVWPQIWWPCSVQDPSDMASAPQHWPLWGWPHKFWQLGSSCIWLDDHPHVQPYVKMKAWMLNFLQKRSPLWLPTLPLPTWGTIMSVLFLLKQYPPPSNVLSPLFLCVWSLFPADCNAQALRSMMSHSFKVSV